MRKRTDPHPPELPHPQPALDPRHRPFVGNADVDENLAEAVQVALRGVLGEAGKALFFAVEGGRVRLDGPLADDKLRARLLGAIAKVPGVVQIEDRLQSSTPTAPTVETGVSGPRPLLQVRRFCGLDSASINAAIRQAIGVLDAEAARLGLAVADELVLVYRNLQPHTITLEVGMPVEHLTEALAGSEVRPGLLPQGEMATAPVAAGLAAMLSARRRLVAAETAAGHRVADWWWQQFGTGDFRPWTELPAGQIRLLRVN